MIIAVPPEIEKALADQARRLGTTPEVLALDSLRERFGASVSSGTPTEGQESLAEFLGGHIGVLRSSEYFPGGARMSEGSGKRFAACLLKQRQQGRQ